jgi:hypothetical protein
VQVEGTCARVFTLQTTAPLRDDRPESPREVADLANGPVVRTNSAMFDALYALAWAEVGENAVETIRDGSFNNGSGVACPPGGCFETGRLWNYVWTRDTAYAVDLGLAALDPTRARNSLEFKLSERRGGGDLQIVQDTGSGGSYPVSSDRVVWALGARALLAWLEGPERDAFMARTFEALRNTAEHDRRVVFDAADGLYRGEQSFLDWREQSYPEWTANDVVHLAMSKALSTNVGHLILLRTAADLADRLGGDGARYRAWAQALSEAIRARLWLPEAGMLSAFVTTGLDDAPSPRTELLGASLAVLEGVLTPAEAATAVAAYPHLAMGPPVLWPQQKNTPIYHNRGIWPFVTAYGLRAARAVGNDAVVDLDARSLLRGAALNLSNMENFELVTGQAWLEDGAQSGPVVNSQRQLWSVAAWFTLVHHVVFGLDADLDGLSIAPFVTRTMRRTWFAQSDELVLAGLPYRGARLDVVVHLPPAEPGAGAYAVAEVRLDGAVLPEGRLLPGLQGPHRVDVTLGPAGPAAAMALVEDVADYRVLFGPKTPRITGVRATAGGLALDLSRNGEAAADVRWEVLRDGVVVATDLPGETPIWTDAEASAESPSHCYVARTRYASGNASQHSPPWCWWGAQSERVVVFAAPALEAVGGRLTFNHGRDHYEAWGDAGHELVVPSFTAQVTGRHYVQANYGNGAGPVSTGITCAVKRLDVVAHGTDASVGGGYLVMPHLGDWDRWADGNLVPVDLVAGTTYRLVISSDDAHAVNMSVRAHFASYTGGLGGQAGAFNRVNISQVKVLAAVAR